MDRLYRLKVAICFSGHLRDWEKSSSYWGEIQKRYKADVYCSFWEDLTLPRSEEVIPLEGVGEFLSFYNPVDVEWENNKLFNVTTLNQFRERIKSPRATEISGGLSEEDAIYTESGMILPMWWKIWKANLLAQKHGEYDVIIRTRTDVYLDKPLNLEKNEDLNLPVGIVFNRNWENCYGWIDLVFWGNPKVMNRTTDLFLYLPKYLKEGHYFNPTENIFRTHLAQQEFNINHHRYALFLTRKEFSNGSSLNGGLLEGENLLKFGFGLNESDFVEFGNTLIKMGYEEGPKSYRSLRRDPKFSFFRGPGDKPGKSE